jgi:oligopeptide transport system ATP-binding protein
MLIECNDLTVRFRIDDDELVAVQDLSFELGEKECLGIVGESGSGKSQLVLAMLGLLATNGHATGSVRFRGQEILNAPRARLDELRGKHIAMAFQDALSGLTPTMRIGKQLCESAQQHLDMTAREARTKALELLHMMRIPDPEQRMRAYPFELSGGMRQRIMIALAMICRPEVLIADEPTPALDVTIQAQILKLLDELKRDANTSVILITHDLAVAVGLCDRLLILYGGRVVEAGTTRDVFRGPQHPYTIGLLNSVPRLDSDPDVDLPAIPGQPVDVLDSPVGCAFAERCEHTMEQCRSVRPPLVRVDAKRAAACHLVGS